MKKFIIIIPLFNDWKSVSKLLKEIDVQIANWDAEISIIIVNDASTENRPDLNIDYKKIKLLKILNLKKNKVHQRCIATGLKYIFKNEDFDRVIVMDADGEDRPEELNDFFKKSQEKPTATITGNRFKRSEGMVFRILYEIHKLLTLAFTGKLIKFGNFTCLPKSHVEKLIKNRNLWNSYSPTVVRVVSDRTFIPSIRGHRYVLPSKMNFTSLVFHSLSIISVFKNTVIIRSIIFSFIYFFLFFNNISLINILPILLLFLFTSYILKISTRSNMEEFNKSLENIESIDILGSPDSR
jgi:glycosyltransferase involved in cell wall biosynthesis